MRLSEIWLEGLVSNSGIDGTRLGKGSTALKKEQVGAIEIEPGLIRAVVHSASEAVTVVGVATLSNTEWAEIMELVTSKAVLSAALLAGEVPDEIAPYLVPKSGQMSCDCSCADGGEPCVHAAALLHCAADLFDVEPFALVLIRGRGRNDVLTEVRARRSQSLGLAEPAGVSPPRGVDPGTSSTDAWRREPLPVDASQRIPRQPGSLVTLAAPPPSDSGIDEAQLRMLVEDAASRALGVLAGEEGAGLSLSVGSDVVRRAVRGDVATISEATKIPKDELASAARAWELGGAAGLRASRRTWEPAPELVEPGIRALGPGAKSRGNRVSRGGEQLRVDEDGMWWLFRSDDELGWVLASESSPDPSDLY